MRVRVLFPSSFLAGHFSLVSEFGLPAPQLSRYSLLQVERVVTGAEGQFLVKWKGLDYVASTWEFDADLQAEADQVQLHNLY